MKYKIEMKEGLIKSSHRLKRSQESSETWDILGPFVGYMKIYLRHFFKHIKGLMPFFKIYTSGS